ncbi:MAG: phosphoglucosamine mutase [Succinivibrionaceae bacterium]|nr:phosphoglucosamine mutase [Succinivibrionaceae bacterium]
MERKYFGTDGVRGAVGTFPITPEFVLRLGFAAGKVLSKKSSRRVLIGQDTRISGFMLQSALVAGLSAAGIKSILVGTMPTPAIAYLTRAFRCDAGVVISASHNPYYDNGIKFFSAFGTKLPDEVELEIESLLDKELSVSESKKLGSYELIDDAAGRYIEFCKSTFPFDKDLSQYKIVLDCANGATHHIAPAVFSELGADIVAKIGCEPDGININDKVGSTHLDKLVATVLDKKADLGIAFDGDGDRLMFVDSDGTVVDGDGVLYIIATYLKEFKKLNGGIVGTLMSNFGLELAFKRLSIPFIRASVGDRYVLEKLQEQNWRLGGENSGHIISLDHTSTGDGIISALQVMKALVRTGKTLHESLKGLSMMPQVLVNKRFVEGMDPLHDQNVLAAVKEAERQLGDNGRVLLRKSGTEPLIRVMVEGSDKTLVTNLANMIASKV